jgi:hypothetical protein
VPEANNATVALGRYEQAMLASFRPCRLTTPEQFDAALRSPAVLARKIDDEFLQAFLDAQAARRSR